MPLMSPRVGRYRHYKGNEYTLLGVARHSETQEALAVYRPEYGERGLWVRPLAMFCEFIEVAGKIVRRFQCIEPPAAWTDQCLVRRGLHSDASAIDNVHERAFGRRDEADLVRSLLEGPWNTLSLVAEHDGQVIAHLLLTRLEIVTDQDSTPSRALAPVSVLPDYQRRGVGSLLIEAAIDLARQAQEQTIFVLGHPAYYERFGFQNALTQNLQCVYACDAWMALELVPQSLEKIRGEVRYAPPFCAE